LALWQKYPRVQKYQKMQITQTACIGLVEMMGKVIVPDHKYPWSVYLSIADELIQVGAPWKKIYLRCQNESELPA